MRSTSAPALAQVFLQSENKQKPNLINEIISENDLFNGYFVWRTEPFHRGRVTKETVIVLLHANQNSSKTNHMMISLSCTKIATIKTSPDGNDHEDHHHHLSCFSSLDSLLQLGLFHGDFCWIHVLDQQPIVRLIQVFSQELDLPGQEEVAFHFPQSSILLNILAENQRVECVPAEFQDLEAIPIASRVTLGRRPTPWDATLYDASIDLLCEYFERDTCIVGVGDWIQIPVDRSLPKVLKSMLGLSTREKSELYTHVRAYRKEERIPEKPYIVSFYVQEIENEGFSSPVYQIHPIQSRVTVQVQPPLKTSPLHHSLHTPNETILKLCKLLNISIHSNFNPSILVHGPVSVGKSYHIQQASLLSGHTIIPLDLSSYTNDSTSQIDLDARISLQIEMAWKCQPSLLLIRRMDLLSKESTSFMKKKLEEILNKIQNSMCVLVGTTSDLERMEGSILSLFHRHIQIQVPDQMERTTLLQTLLPKSRVKEEMGMRTAGFQANDLMACVAQASVNCVKRIRRLKEVDGKVEIDERFTSPSFLEVQGRSPDIMSRGFETFKSSTIRIKLGSS
jgi:hypothetical protein